MSGPRTHTCICGAMTWRIADDARGTHLICYCADCQTYGNVLDHGLARMDTDGGTEIFKRCPEISPFLKAKNIFRFFDLDPKAS